MSTLPEPPSTFFAVANNRQFKGILRWVTFTPNSPADPIAGIAGIDEGTYVNGRWVAGHRLNGDASHQSRHLRLPNGHFGIQHIKLYRYR